MSKGYWIATVKVTNPEQYREYQSLAAVALGKYNATLVVRSDEVNVMESSNGQPIERCVIFEFPSMQHAIECYHSHEYREAREARTAAAIVDIIILPVAD